ncbi:MAG TPA: hypothetical protein VGR71_06220 [Nitrospira sp.]|nr:hypothetical protein [Nitrospira sp.]
MSGKRANYIGAPEMFNLNAACCVIRDAFPDTFGCYLVGSSLEKRDYRDVDIRCIVPDEEYEKMFPGGIKPEWTDAKWSLLCASISEWLRARTGLPVDFQFQQMTYANEKFGRETVGSGKRHAIGLLNVRTSTATVEEGR